MANYSSVKKSPKNQAARILTEPSPVRKVKKQPHICNACSPVRRRKAPTKNKRPRKRAENSVEEEKIKPKSLPTQDEAQIPHQRPNTQLLVSEITKKEEAVIENPE